MNLPASAQPASLAADQRRRRPLVGLTPLIDVVFILLVFFMLASSFLDWRAIELNAPAEASVAGTLEGALLIEVRADDLRLGGEAIALGAVAQAVRGRLDEAPDTRVLVRPAEGVELQRAVDVLDRLSAAGVTDLSLIRAGAR